MRANMTRRDALIALPIALALLCVIGPAAAAPPPISSAQASPSPSATPLLGDVFVTAQRRNGTQASTTRETLALTGDDLARLGATTVADALALLPGIVINTYGTAGHVQTALLRGASSAETLVLIDGRPANEPGVGEFDFSSLPVSAVARVEVVEGAASALWGSSAMGGVIDIITKSPLRGAGAASATLGFEGASTAQVDASAADAAGNGIRVAASQTRARDAFTYPSFLGTPGGSLVDDDAAVRDAFVTVAERIGPVRATGHFGDDTSDVGEPGSVEFGASTLARQQRNFTRGDLSLELPGPANDLVVQVYSDGQRLHYFDPTDEPANFVFPYDDLSHIDTRGIGVRDTVGMDRSTLTFGVDAKGDRAQFDQTFAGARSSAPAADATTGWFASEEYQAGDGITATAALRDERPQGFPTTAVPSVGAMWRSASSGFGMRANYGRAFRIPALEETSPLFFGNPALKPEYAATFDVGAFDGPFSLTYFGLRATNLIVSEPPAFTPENVSEAEVRGIDGEYGARIGRRLALHASYTDYPRAQDLVTGSRLIFRPTATGSLTLTREAGAGASTGLAVDYVGRRYAEDPNTVALPQYATIGAFATRRIGGMSSITLRLNDLTGERVEAVPGYPVLGTTASVTLGTTW